jgi:hypothetical protein
MKCKALQKNKKIICSYKHNYFLSFRQFLSQLLSFQVGLVAKNYSEINPVSNKAPIDKEGMK